MSHRHKTHWTVCLVSLALLTWPAGAGEDEAPFGDSYTKAELAALDRALHAANMNRKDLTFRKDLTKGHQTLPAVARMLREPLTIAPFVDRWAQFDQSSEAKINAPHRLLLEALRVLAPESGWTGQGAEAEFSGTDVWDLIEDYQKKLILGASIYSYDEGVKTVELALRRELPGSMAWHDVFSSPFDEKQDEKIDAWIEDQPAAWLHEAASRGELVAAVRTWVTILGVGPDRLARLKTKELPEDRPYVIETPLGRIALGTLKDDVYEGDYAVLIEPGGNDRYLNCRIGAASGRPKSPLGFFADLGGDDVYECGDVNITLGAAVLGVAAFYDLGAGNDRYVGGHCSLGAAMGGVAVFYDDGGTDSYQGKTFTQGAAGFGIGIFYDDSVQKAPVLTKDERTKDPVDIGLFDNDRLSAWANAQAFARCKGIALCVNKRGNEIYEAGGVYLHAPLFADRYQSFSQGFAIGERGVDYAGGIALLIDHDGNDRYLGDVYNQGVGYWYAAGLLYDGGGNDTYEMTQYGQGSGIHLAVGGLIDAGGHDTYVMHSGLGQGGSHDYAASILHDRGGNDRYLGSTSCNGSALTNSVGLHFDRSGNDVYAGRRKGAVNFGRPARGFSSIGVLLDLDGTDDYLGIMKDESLWRHTDIGVGWDTVPEPVEKPSDTTAKPDSKPEDDAGAGVKVPPICSHEGELTQEVFDELWAIAVRWEVGENRFIVPKARERLIAFGAVVLPYMDAKMEESASGLELRAYLDVLKALREGGAEESVLAFLRKNAAHETERRRRVALYLVGEMKVAELEDVVVAMLVGENESVARRAAGVLKRIGSHAGDERLLSWLEQTDDELRLQAALGTLLGLDSDCYAKVRVLLDHPLMSVRTRLVVLLVEHFETYGDVIRGDLQLGKLSIRAQRTLLDVLARAKVPPEGASASAVALLVKHHDWGVRADAVRVIRHWEALEGTSGEFHAAAREVLEPLRASEKDPYVRFWLDAGKAATGK